MPCLVILKRLAYKQARGYLESPSTSVSIPIKRKEEVVKLH